MGNAWCCLPNSFIIDYSHRKIVISQGVQCSLLVPASHCHQLFNAKQICSPVRHCKCGIYQAAGDKKTEYCNDNNKTPVSPSQITLKSKIGTKENIYNKEQDALVSLSETFSESSFEDFVTRKRLDLNKKHNKMEFMEKLNNFRDDDASCKYLNNNSFYDKQLNNSTDLSCEDMPECIPRSVKRLHPRNDIRKKKRRNRNRNRNSIDSLSNNSLSTNNSLNLNNVQDSKTIPTINEISFSETTSTEETKKTIDFLPTFISPKKSILKNSDTLKEPVDETRGHKNKKNSLNAIVVPVENQCNSLDSDKYSTYSLSPRSMSAMNNHDSLDQLMSLLKSSTLLNEDETIKSKKSKSIDCLNKTVNFKDVDECHQKFISKTGYQIQPDGKIKKRLILRETYKLFDIINDPNDRRIRAICDRYQCDLEIFVRPPKIGLMYFAIEIMAPDKYSLRMCVRELDSSMKWCISSQLF